MQKTLRIVSLFMLCMLVFSLLIACSPQGIPNTTAPAASQTKGTSPVETADPFLTGEKPVLKMVAPFAAIINTNKDPVEKEIEEITGYKVEYTMLPQAEGPEKLFMELASGVSYDIVKAVPDTYYKLVGQNALLPLDNLIEKYGKDMKEAISDHTWSLGIYDGVTYCIPQKTERPRMDHTLTTRKDLMEELSLKMPTTPEELYNYLKAIKKAKPDMIPLSLHCDTYGTDGVIVFNPTIISAFNIYSEWMDVNGTLVHRIHMPGGKEYMQFMAKLYKEELLDPDYPINKQVNVYEKFSSGKAACIYLTFTGAEIVYPSLRENIPGAEGIVIQPLYGPNGECGFQASVRLNYTASIPKTAKNPEHAMIWMNEKLKKDNFTHIAVGYEGETFNLVDGKYIPIMPAFTEKRNTAYWYLTGTREVEYSEMWLARLRRHPDVGGHYDDQTSRIDEFYRENPVGYMPPLESVTKYEKTVQKLIIDNYIKFVTGTRSFDEYDEFLKEVDNAGLDKMTEEVNKWYAKLK